MNLWFKCGSGCGGASHRDLAVQQYYVPQRGPVAPEAGSCTSPAVPWVRLCCSPSLLGLARVQPSVVQGRRLVFGRLESHAGAVLLLFEQAG